MTHTRATARQNSMVNLLFLLLTLFVVVPLVELTLLFQLADLTDWTIALLIVVATGLAGTLLARAQGFRTLQRIRSELAAGRLPSDALMDAVMILVAGGVLLAPGLLTDLFGLSLLVPISRRFYRQQIASWLKSNVTLHGFPDSSSQPAESQVIDSYVVSESTPEKTGQDDKDDRPPHKSGLAN